jgi:hypothetical protein
MVSVTVKSKLRHIADKGGLRMSSGGEPEFGSGAYYGDSGGGRNPNAPGGFPGTRFGLPGMGGFPGFGNMGRQMGPGGPFGAYPSCGCSGCIIMLAGILLVFGGCLRMLGQ